MISEEFEYNYATPSVSEETSDKKKFLLSHCTEVEDDKKIQCFFYGNIKDSFVASKCLSVLAKIVRSHFSLAPSQSAGLRDPIVSVGSNQLRFEAFSSCNSVYSRIDLSDTGIDGEFLASGCTNVDFNDTTVRALNMVNRSEKLILGVGQKDIKISTEHVATTEKKVSLPNRWIKGLSNVQLYLSQMEFVSRLNQVQALQLFKDLPKTPVKNDYFINQQQPGRFQLSPVPKGKSICIGGIHRLRVVETLLPFIKELSLYRDNEDQGFALILHFGNIQMLLAFSASVYRGFSGEGKNLENMVSYVPDEWIIGINHQCKTNEMFNSTLLAIENDINPIAMENLQASLSSIGLLGYDLIAQQHFYRRLPFKLQRLKSLNPRYQNAQKLIEKDEVKIISKDEYKIEAEVKGSGDIMHKVLITNESSRCTCTWYTNHQNKRGLCKHILAVKMKFEPKE